MINFNLTNRVAIVTGGTRGIGRGITESFLKSGARVVASYAGNHDAANAFKAQLGELGENLYLEAFDVSDASAVEEFWNRMNEQFEQIHILVNNSGIRRDNLSPIMPDEDWARVLDINLTGTFLMTKRAVNHFLSKRYGRIINMSSVGGSLGLPGQANYAASKAGIIGMTKSLAIEYAKKNITLNCVSPGFIQSNMTDKIVESIKAVLTSRIPMSKLGTGEDVANTAAFLSSDSASYITGETIHVNGGMYMA